MWSSVRYNQHKVRINTHQNAKDPAKCSNHRKRWRYGPPGAHTRMWWLPIKIYGTRTARINYMRWARHFLRHHTRIINLHVSFGVAKIRCRLRGLRTRSACIAHTICTAARGVYISNGPAGWLGASFCIAITSKTLMQAPTKYMRSPIIVGVGDMVHQEHINRAGEICKKPINPGANRPPSMSCIIYCVIITNASRFSLPSY